MTLVSFVRATINRQSRLFLEYRTVKIVSEASAGRDPHDHRRLRGM
jgi:hypothetical protein